MTELLWQTTFLLAVAFFCGAVLACGLKRRFYYGTRQKGAGTAASGAPVAAPAADPSQPKIEVAARAAPEGQRFERALSGTAEASAAPAARSSTAAPAAAPPRAEAPAQLVVPPTSVRVEPVKAPSPAPSPAPVQPEVKPGIPRVSVATGSGAPAKTEEGGAGPSDDLTRIRGIDPILQGRLKELGIRRFKDLAGLTARDVKGLSETLGLDARVSLENWVGQAQILAAGGETYYSRRVDQGVPVPEVAEPTAPTPAPAPAAPAAAPAAEPALVAAPATPEPAPSSIASAPTAAAPEATPASAAAKAEAAPAADVAHLRSVRSEALIGEEAARATSVRSLSDVDDLKRIRGIGVLIEKKLNSLGITNYEQVANWTGADIERISRILDFKGRIERESWIEQARILATGGQTEFSRRGG